MAMVIYQGPIPTSTSHKIEDETEKLAQGRFVGLSNQGATCYLNGLLQTLFMTPDFRRAIFAWNYDKEKDGKEDLCIPLQLQRLFGLLQLGKQEVVDTVALTKSFGWEGSEVFQQQDVQELTRVLFDALEVYFKGTSMENIIDELYAGQLIDYLRCIDVDYESQRVDKFLDFSLAIVPFGSDKPMRNLKECIEMYLRPEILNGDNQYYAEKFNMKVDAIKGLKFGKLPQIMSVQLKRFVYDFSGPSIVQKKLNDVVKFPMILDMNKYVATLKKRKRSDSSHDGPDESSSPCGDDIGNSTTSSNDTDGSSAMSVEEEPNEEFEAFLKRQLEVLKASEEKNGSSTSGSAEGVSRVHRAESMDADDINSDAEGFEDLDDDDLPPLVDYVGLRSPDQVQLDTRKKVLKAKRKQYQSMSDEEVKHLLETRGEWIYELYAVLIHSGAISGGHYYAYIKDLNRKGWWNFNDSVVSAIDEKTVQETWGSSIKVTTTNNGTGYSGYTSMNPMYTAAHSTVTTTRLSSSNAYMLMYRKLTVDTISNVEYPSDECVPQYIKDQIKADEEAAAEQRRLEEEARNRMMVKVHWQGKDFMVETSKKRTLNELMVHLWTFLKLAESVSVESTTAVQRFISENEVHNEAVTLIPHLLLFRFRNFSAHTKIMAEDFDMLKNGDKTLLELGIYDYRQYCIEMRLSPETPWEVFYVDGLSILLEGYDGNSQSFLEPRSVRLPKYCTVGDLRAIISKFVTYDISRIQICRFFPSGVSDARMDIYTNDFQRLREDLHLFEGQSLCYEERTWGPEVLNMSPAFTRYLDNRNRVTLTIRTVNSTVTYLLTIDLRWKVQEMRKKVGELYDLDPEYVRLFKFSEKGQELKDGDVIGYGSVYAGMSIFVSKGKPTPVGYFGVELVLYEPQEKVRVVSLPELAPDNPENEELPYLDTTLRQDLLPGYVSSSASVPSSSSSSSAAVHHSKVNYLSVDAAEQSTIVHSLSGDLTKNMNLHRSIDAINVESYESSGIDDRLTPEGYCSGTFVVAPPSLSASVAHALHPSPAIAAASYMAQSVSHGSDQDTDNMSTDGIADCEDCGDIVLGQEMSREEQDARMLLDNSNMAVDYSVEENISHLVNDSQSGATNRLRKHSRDFEASTAQPAEVQPGSVILLPDASTPPAVRSELDEVQPSGFGQLTVANNYPSEKIYRSLDCLKDIYIKNDMLVSELRQIIVERLIQNGTVPEDFSPRRIRIRDKANTYPSRILYDGATFAENRLALTDHKVLIVQILDQEESIGSVMESGDSVIYFQRWNRSTWSMGERMEVLLRGSMTVRDVSRSLALLTDIPLQSLMVMVMPRDIELYLSDLVDKSTVYNYGRSWFDPTHEVKLLKYMSHEFRVQDSNLLLLQDRAEPLMQLSPADQKSIEIVKNASSNSMADEWPSTYATVYNSSNIGSYPSSGTSSYNYHTSFSGSGAKVSNGGGIRIKTHQDRMKEQSSDKLADNASVASGSNPFDGTTDSSLHNNGDSYDTKEFYKQGGYTLFADMD